MPLLSAVRKSSPFLSPVHLLITDIEDLMCAEGSLAADAQAFRQAIPSSSKLFTMSVGKLDQALNPGDGKRRPVLMDVLNASAHVEAIHNPLRHDALIAQKGPSRTFPI